MDAQELKQLAGDIAILVRKEIDSGREEMSGKLKSAGVGAGMLSGSALTGLITLGSLTALIIIALATVVAAWLAALIVTLLWAIATAVLALGGKSKIQEATPLAPTETIENIKEDVQWAQRELKSSNRP